MDDKQNAQRGQYAFGEHIAQISQATSLRAGQEAVKGESVKDLSGDGALKPSEVDKVSSVVGLPVVDKSSMSGFEKCGLEKGLTVITRSNESSVFSPIGEFDLARTLGSCSSLNAREILPLDVALSYEVLPLSCLLGGGGERRLLSLLVSQELDAQKARELEVFTGCDLSWEVCARDVLMSAITQAYCRKADGPIRYLTLANAYNNAPSTELGQVMLEELVLTAVGLAASDIHIEIRDSKACVRFRVDGLLEEYSTFSFNIDEAKQVVRCLKVKAGLDVCLYREPQEGSFVFKYQGQETYLRLSFIPIFGGEKAVARLLTSFCSSDSGSDLLRLGMSHEQVAIIRSSLQRNSRTLIFSGPTGSGKSTLLHVALKSLTSCAQNIVSIEDPVERVLKGVTQVEVDEPRGLGYQVLLPYVLRQDPDVIGIGEIRNRSVAELALNAGLTGHLVLSTIHAGNSFEILSRLQHMGVSMELIIASISLLGSQRLVPKNCPKCRYAVGVSPSFRRRFALPDNHTLLASRGCEFCHRRGVLGRLGVYEFLRVTEEIRDILLVHRRVVLRELLPIAAQQGYRPIVSTLRDALISGRISPSSACQCLGLKDC